MKKIDLRGMSRDELTDLLEEVMVRLRHVEAEEIKSNFVTKSQKLRLEESVREHLRQSTR
ncbi:MAG: hypothetical protein LV479_02525 [Methylacidiphilales bacterium]|nr:hypothetical protein [Candidatus Methylacidiphilales bacterium]